VFGLLPAISFSRPDVSGGLKDGGRALTSGAGRQWMRNALVVSEVALAVVLLVGAAFFLVSFSRVTRVDLGMDIEHVVTVRISPPDDAQQVPRRMAQILDRVALIPGVNVAAMAGSAIPLFGSRISYPIRLPGTPFPTDSDGIDRREVSADYFRALQIPLLAGRFFDDADRAGSAPVAILNQTAAERYFGAANAVGQMIEVKDGAPPLQVVGVVRDVRQFGPERQGNAAFFLPFDQSSPTWGMLVLRTTDKTSAVLSAANAAIWAEFPDNVSEVNALRDVLADRLAARRFNMVLLGLFGLLGLVIAALGVYGVMSHAVTQRTQEIGIRMALGATSAAILQMILSRAIGLVVTGLVIGVAGAWNLAGLAESFLFEVRPHDITIYVAVGIVLLTTGMVAALVPARRASRIDPLIALRME
jgi:predicted permease